MAIPFFWRQALKRSTLLDIETTGLDPSRHAPVGAATARFGAPVQETWFTYETAERIPKGPWYRKFSIKTEEEMIGLMEPFAQLEWQKSWAGARRKWITGGGVPTPARKYFSKVLAREARAGRFLWTHNVRFDITQFGSQFAHPAAQRMMYERAAVPGWTKFDPYSGRVFPTTTREAFQMRSILYEKPHLAPGAMRGWYGSYRRMVREAVRGGKPAVLDSLAIAQSMLGMAQQRGAMRATGDIFTGTSIEALAAAFGVTAKGRAHLATTDVETMQRILPRLLETTEALYKGKKLKGYQAKALKYLGEVQPEIAKRNVERMFAQAATELRETGKYRLRKGGYSTNLDDLVGVYKKFYKHRSYYFEGMLEETMGRVKGMAKEELDYILLERAKIPKAIGFGSKVNMLRTEFGAKMRRFLAGRNPYLMAGVAALAAFGVGAFMLPDREEHQTVIGLKDNNSRVLLEHLRINFGANKDFDKVKHDQVEENIDKLRKAYWNRQRPKRRETIRSISSQREISQLNQERAAVQAENAQYVHSTSGWLNWLDRRTRVSGTNRPIAPDKVRTPIVETQPVEEGRETVTYIQPVAPPRREIPVTASSGKLEKETMRYDAAVSTEPEPRQESGTLWNYADHRMMPEAPQGSPRMGLYNGELAGLSEQGIAPRLRHIVTDFGSKYQAVAAISKWAVRFSEGATARYLTQAEVRDMLVYLRSQIKNSQLLRVGRSSFGLEMTDAVLKENIAAIRKLEAAKGYKGGVMLLKQEHFVAIPDRRMRIEAIKRSVLHESFHSAAANVKNLQERIAEGKIPQNLIKTFEIEGYGLSGTALEISETAAARTARLREEAAAFLTYPHTAGIQNIRDSLANALHEEGVLEYIGELKRMHQAYVTETPVVQARAAASGRSIKRAEMTKDTMKKHAPRIVGVRVDDSPGVEGMVQKMHNKRKGSHNMYHR